MNSDLIKLLTQILILASAVIGLYKIVRFKPRKRIKANSNKKEKSSIFDIFKPLLAIVGIFAFMLAIPLFTYLFMLVMNLTMNVPLNNNNKVKEIGYSTYTINDSIINDTIYIRKEEQLCFSLYKTALLASTSTRNSLLDSVVNKSISINLYDLAILSASKMTYHKIKDQTLIKMVDSALLSKDYEAARKAAYSIIVPRTKDKALKKNFSQVQVDLELKQKEPKDN